MNKKKGSVVAFLWIFLWPLAPHSPLLRHPIHFSWPPILPPSHHTHTHTTSHRRWTSYRKPRGATRGESPERKSNNDTRGLLRLTPAQFRQWSLETWEWDEGRSARQVKTKMKTVKEKKKSAGLVWEMCERVHVSADYKHIHSYPLILV